MPEQPPPFVVVDRRKFTLEGEMREGAQPTPPEEQRAPAAPSPVAGLAANDLATNDLAANDLAEESMAGSIAPLGERPLAPETPEVDADAPETEFELQSGLDSGLDSGLGLSEEDDVVLDVPSAEESAAQESAYRQSASYLDAMLQQANPGMKAPGAVGFEHLVQSFYLSAVMAMGAGTQPGQQPRVDILGARQAIDLLGVLAEKTRGNLTAEELQLLQGITFELRMSFLELTNAISRQAMQGPPPGGAR